MIYNNNLPPYRIPERLPYIIWDLIGYVFIISNIIFQNKILSYVSFGIFFVFYIINLIFDMYTVPKTFKINNYNELTFYQLLIYSPYNILKYELKEPNIDVESNHINTNNWRDGNDVYIDLYFNYNRYNKNINNDTYNWYLDFILYYIHMFGLTKKHLIIYQNTLKKVSIDKINGIKLGFGVVGNR